MSDCSINANVHLFPNEAIRFRAGVYPNENYAVLRLGEGSSLVIYLHSHPDTPRLEAAVAAFNAVLDGKNTEAK